MNRMDAKRPARRRAAYERMPPLERFLGKEGKETRGKRYYYFKPYMQQGLLGHFAMQPSPHAQRMLAAFGKEAAERAALVWEKGRTIKSLKGTAFLLRNKRKILDQIAGAIVDHIRLGVSHGDMHSENIIVSRSRGRRQPIKVKIIDYAGAYLLKGETLEFTERARKKIKGELEKAVARGEMDEGEAKRYINEALHMADDYPEIIDSVIPVLAKDEKDKKALERYFERRFLDRARKKL